MTADYYIVYVASGCITPFQSPMKAIWIDLDNSPHVPLFVPIIEHYRERDVEVLVTARDHSQTIDLLDLAGLKGSYSVVGRHYGGNKMSKTLGLFIRARQLAREIRSRKTEIAAAVSHGSRSMVLAARWLKIPIISMYDYEHNETRIFNKLSDKVLVPERIPDAVLDRIGLTSAKREKYPGLKEELYINKFRPSPDFRERLLAEHSVESENVVFVVLRPPATTANYHDTRSEQLFDAVLNRLLTAENVFTLISPRTLGQANEIRKSIPANKTSFAFLDKAVNGLDLNFAADLVISGGGTMNREAAVLGVPVYSSFAGPRGSLDDQMEAEGLIKFIRDVSDVDKIDLRRRERMAFSNVLTDRVERFVIERIDEFREC